MKIEKIECSPQNINKYMAQTNVIRKSNFRNTNLRFGKIVVCTDADPDG